MSPKTHSGKCQRGDGEQVSAAIATQPKTSSECAPQAIAVSLSMRRLSTSRQALSETLDARLPRSVYDPAGAMRRLEGSRIAGLIQSALGDATSAPRPGEDRRLTILSAPSSRSYHKVRLGLRCSHLFASAAR